MVLTDLIWTHVPGDRHRQHRHRPAAGGDPGAARAPGAPLPAPHQACITRDAQAVRELRARARHQRLLQQSRRTHQLLPDPQGRALQSRRRRLRRLGHGRAARAVCAARRGAGVHRPDEQYRAAEDQSPARVELERTSGPISAPTSSITVRCTIAAIRASAARPARERSSPERITRRSLVVGEPGLARMRPASPAATGRRQPGAALERGSAAAAHAGGVAAAVNGRLIR